MVGRRAALHRLALLGLAWWVMLGASACAQGPVWQRSWAFQSFDCPSCSAEDRSWLQSRIGQVVVIAPERFLNPLYEDCSTGADYSDIRLRSAEEARQFLGRNRLPPLAAAAPLAGQVRCRLPSGPPNVVARIVIDGKRAFLLHETGAVLMLR